MVCVVSQNVTDGHQAKRVERPSFLVIKKGSVSHASSLRMPREKNVRLTLSMNLSSMTAPDYGKMCPNFCYRGIQFNQSQAWTWSYLRASHCLWSNERPGICYLLIFPVPEVRTHLPIIRDCHGAQIH